MPLLHGKKNIGHNISEMESAGHPRNQSIAAALNVARQHKDAGGVSTPKVKTPGPQHAGPINSTVAGRTDHLPIEVPSGAYVIPADIVSHMGESNTQAGFKVLRRMFAGSPRNATPTPYQGAGGPYDAGPHPYDQKPPLPYGSTMARGGSSDGVPIVAAGGEHVLTPDDVRSVGAGDLDRGHRVLDKWVLKMRAELIKTLKRLKPPRKD